MRTFWFSEEKLFFKNRIITRKITSGKLDPKLFQKKTTKSKGEKIIVGKEMIIMENNFRKIHS
jgi:hypothetical protein